MKNFKKLYTIALLLLIQVFNVTGQKTIQDSICVHIDDQMELNLTVFEYKGLSDQLGSDLKSLQDILKNKNDLPEKGSFKVVYEPKKMLSIKPGEPEERIIWEDGRHTHYQFNSQCNLISDTYCLHIHFSDLWRLTSDSLIIRIKEVVDRTSALTGRFASVFSYSYKGTELIHNKQHDKIKGQMDAIFLKGGVGINYIKNQPVIDISAEMGFAFSHKGIWKNQYYMSYNQLSDFADPLKINLSGFANIGYRYNMSRKVGDPNWLGIELGYLVARQGELLDKNTFRLGFNWEIGKSITVAPQLYFSGKSTFPALRIGFGL
jgi:hypothetical protein